MYGISVRYGGIIMALTPSKIRSAVVNGKTHYSKVEFPKLKEFYGDGELKLGSLTDGDLAEVENLIENGGVDPISVPVTPGNPNDRNQQAVAAKKQIDVTVDPIATGRSKYDAKVLAICLSLNNADETAGWTEEDIRRWPAGTVKEVAKAVYEITGVDDPDKTRKEVEDFREDESKSSD